MRVVIQRVSNANVDIDNETHGSIKNGLLLLLGVGENDTEADADWLVKKIVTLRIFEDEDGKMNRDILQAGGDFLVVSQFTLHAKYKKGTRPSFIKAARPDLAIPMYEYFCEQLRVISERKVETGQFGAMMEVSLCNSGPVTIWMDTENKE